MVSPGQDSYRWVLPVLLQAYIRPGTPKFSLEAPYRFHITFYGTLQLATKIRKYADRQGKIEMHFWRPIMRHKPNSNSRQQPELPLKSHSQLHLHASEKHSPRGNGRPLWLMTSCTRQPAFDVTATGWQTPNRGEHVATDHAADPCRFVDEGDGIMHERG